MMIGVIIFFLFRFGYKITVWSKQLKKSGVILLILALICIPLTLKLEIPFLKKESFSKPESEILISDFRNESEVYDKLAISNHGDLLADIYLQTKRGMVLENQGGISVKVSDVSLMEVEEVESDNAGIAYKCSWQVKGSVGHWGHIHQRTNQYQAVLRKQEFDYYTLTSSVLLFCVSPSLACPASAGSRTEHLESYFDKLSMTYSCHSELSLPASAVRRVKEFGHTCLPTGRLR
jgi:hypothetical protein